MKKFIIAILVSCATVSLMTSCSGSLLDIDQKGVTPMEGFYGSDESAEEALVCAYQGMLWNMGSYGDSYTYVPFHVLWNLPGDDMYAAGEYFGDNDFMAQINEFRYDTSGDVNKNAYYAVAYAMYYANNVIEQFPNPSTPVTKRCVAEARVLRAYMQMMLAIGWYNPPFLDHCLTGTELPYNCDMDPVNPMTHEQMLRWCASECDAVYNDLDERASATDKSGATHATKGFAAAVAGKALLFAGDYAAAKAEFEKVINSNKYQLVPGNRFEENFHVEGNLNEEKIFELNHVNIASMGDWDGMIQRSSWMEANIWNWRSDHFKANPSSSYSSIDGWGGCGVPKAFADEFAANDGTDSWRFKATLKDIEDIVYNTTYNLPVDNLSRAEKETSKDLGLERPLYGESFYMPLKPIAKVTDLRSPGNNIRMNNFTIMRYAEVLLMYAECLVQTGQGAAATTILNKIQDRAGAAHKTSGTATMADVKLEKKFEMWLEGCRFVDCVRWGDLDGLKNAGQNVPVMYDKLFRAPEGGDEDVIWQHGSAANSRFYTVKTHVAKDQGADVGFKVGKHEYFPFPFAATSLNPNLVQRDAWR